MAEYFLDRSDVIATFKQVRSMIYTHVMYKGAKAVKCPLDCMS